MFTHPGILPARSLILFLLGSSFSVFLPGQTTTGPSTACHVIDGKFTSCVNGKTEWSDITPIVFGGGATYLYADQADLDPTRGTGKSPVDTLMLMYDQCSLRRPLGPEEYVTVSFKTVAGSAGNERIIQYVIRIFNDNTIMFFEDGVLQPPGRAAIVEGQRGAIGFGKSPSCPVDHVIAEFQAALDAAGSSGYSPDPLFWTTTTPPKCSVSISGPTDTTNVGQLVTYTAVTTGSGKFQWTLDNPVLKDYEEGTAAAWKAIPMAAADLQMQTIQFYWKPLANQIAPMNAGPQDRKVSVTLTLIDGTTCSDQKTVKVERNATAIDKQAEDYYTTNHSGKVLPEHGSWHVANPHTVAAYDGLLFFTFHRQFLSRFDSYRSEFGYPALVTWDPATAPPTDAATNHAARGGSYTPFPKPLQFTTGGATIARDTNGLACDTTGGGEKALGDFATIKLLGCAVTSPWHNRVHVNVGGDMASPPTAPKDPVFWRWHKFVDGIYGDAVGAGLKPSGLIRSAATLSLQPPFLEYQSPLRVFRFFTRLPSVTLVFSEPVAGVVPSTVKVNGTSATAVTGSGAGPYVFTGFPQPSFGLVTFTVAAGAVSLSTGLPFAGDSWQQTFLNPVLDADGDGLSNDDEVNLYFTDPTKVDTDGDGMPDNYEVKHACLNPLIDQSMPMDFEDNPQPGNNDQDGDGVPDIMEFKLGTDPCAPPFPATLFGTNGSGGMLFDINTSTGASHTIGPIAINSVPALAIDPGTGIMYAGTGAGSPLLYHVNPLTAAATLVGNSGLGFAAISELTFSPSGTLFASVNTVGDGGTGGDHLAMLDKATGVAKVLGPYGTCTASCSIEGMEGLAFDSNGKLWGTVSARGRGNPGLYTIDSGTGAATFVAPILDSSNRPPSGGIVSLNFCNSTLFGGTARTLGSTDDGGRLVLISPQTGRFSFVGTATAAPGTSLAALAFQNCSSLPKPPDTDGDGVADSIDNCPTVPNPDQADKNFDGVGDACQTPSSERSTANFLRAFTNGTTSTEAKPIVLSQEPSITDQVTRIVQFRLTEGLTTSVASLTDSLLASLVAKGETTPADAAKIKNEVVSVVAAVCDVNKDNVINIDDINLILAARNMVVAAGDPRDADGDRVITVNDARYCTLKCTKAQCAR